MLIGTLLFMFVIDIRIADAQMIAIGEPALRIIASTFVVAGVCIVLGSVFQALGYSVYSMIVSLARQLIVLVPVAWVLARIGQSIGNDNLVWSPSPSPRSSPRLSRRRCSCASTATSSARSPTASDRRRPARQFSPLFDALRGFYPAQVLIFGGFQGIILRTLHGGVLSWPM